MLIYMNLLNDETYKRFFFNGIDNIDEVKEGIIYFVSKKVYNDHKDENWYELSNNVILEEIKEEAIEKYRQFYRFVTLNDKDKDFQFDVDIEQLSVEIQNTIDYLMSTNKMISTKAGVFITREEAERLDSKPYYVYGEGMKGEEGWTKQIYKILGYLEDLEKSDMLKYYGYWLDTKMYRAYNRGDLKELPYIAEACRLYRERKQKIENQKGKELGD